MHILILGATGRTGKHVLAEALRRGHKARVLVRDPSKITVSSPLLQIVEGTPTDTAILSDAMEGCEAILSALNVSRVNDFPWANLRTPKDFLSTVMKNIISAAPGQGIRRLIFTSAWGVAETRKDIPGWFRWFIEKSNIRYPYEDHARQEELVARSSLEWTSVRPAGLINSKKIKKVIVSFNNHPKPRLVISRLNVARFILDILEAGRYVRQRPVISQ